MEDNRKFAVVTGASSGIGLELAKQFAKNGFNLLLAAEDAGIFEAVLDCKNLGAEARGLQCNLATYDGVETLADAIENYPQPLDAIAINAGVGVGGASFDKTDLQAELNLIQLNVVSVVHLTKRILPKMIERRNGRILYTSSIASVMPGPFESVYSASKAFVQSFAEAIRTETLDKGITVTSLMPGPTETNFFKRAGMEDTKVGQSKKDHPADVAEMGFDALMNGEDHVVTVSMTTKMQAAMGKLLPQSLSAKMHERMTRPNSPENR